MSKAPPDFAAQFGDKRGQPVAKGDNSPARVRSIIDRIARIEEERAGLAADIKDIYQEAKSAGYTPRAIRELVKREMETAEQRAARMAVADEVELIERALGQFAETALGQAAVGKARGDESTETQE